MLPWPSLNRIIDLAEILNASARGIYETKKRSLELGDEDTVKQIGDGKDLLESSVYSVRETDGGCIFRGNALMWMWSFKCELMRKHPSRIK
jgi:hypothetical protein